MATNRILAKRSQLIVIGILTIALIGVLVINTDRVTAQDESAAANLIKSTQKTETLDDSAINEYSSSMFPSILKLISALALVIGCIYLALFLFKKMMGKKYSGNGNNNIMEILETTYVGPKKTITLIRVADKAVLVGTTDTQISVLSELNEEKTKEIVEAIEYDRAVEKEKFKNLFQTATDKLREISLKKKTKTALES